MIWTLDGQGPETFLRPADVRGIEVYPSGSMAPAEYGPRGVRINAVCPGTIETPMVDRMAGAGELDLAATLAITPMARLGTGAEIASAVLWLCSPGASYVTGVALPVDGGYTAQ